MHKPCNTNVPKFANAFCYPQIHAVRQFDPQTDYPQSQVQPAITPWLPVGGNEGQGSAFRAFDNVEGTTSCYIGYTLVTS